MNTNKVITRFAPSPTGFLHMGGARTALFNYLYTKRQDGQYILRIEDTDKERNREEWAIGLIEDLSWLGIQYDLLAKQSERTNLYAKALKKLIEDGSAYEAEKSEKGEGKVVRFKNPNKKITFQDIVRGEVSIDTTDLGDFVIARGLTEPLYHLAVVVDDAEMKITHVIRAEEHLSNTPRQMLLLEALGHELPIYAHLPLVLAKDKSKLSKRKHGETVSLSYYREKGYLPEAVMNYLALLGWHPSGGKEQEIFTPEELLQVFKLEEVQKSGAIFSEEKLRWVNKNHLDKINDDDYLKNLNQWLPVEVKSLPQFSVERLTRALPTLRERIQVYSDVLLMANEGELEYLFETPNYFAKKLIWRQADAETTQKHLVHLQDILKNSNEEAWGSPDLLKDIIWPYADREGRGEVLWPLRYSLSGVDRSPDPFSLLYILGKDESLKRLEEAYNKLQ